MNLEEIKLLVPDYVMGRLDAHESALVRNAIESSAELKELYNDMSDALGFAGSVKLEEPTPQYWATLLPRIHERIELKQDAEFWFDNIIKYWKVLVPVAAVILIVIFYFTVLNKSTDYELTKVNTEEKVKDTSKDDVKKETPKDVVKEPIEDKSEKVVKRIRTTRQRIVRDNRIQFDEEKNEQKELPVNSTDLTAENLEEESVFTGEAAGFEEELESNLNLLTEEEQNSLIKELDNSNL